MSFYPIPQKAYADDRPTEKRAPTVYMKKEHFRKSDKTKKHRCSQCERTDARKYDVSENESRWLCPSCVVRHNRCDEKERPHFVKASELIPNDLS